MPEPSELKVRLLRTGMSKNYYKITGPRDDDDLSFWPMDLVLFHMCEPGKRGVVRKWVDDGVLIDIFLKG